ncbi:hypothetical protein HMPREF1522_0696 [Actinomyces sp. ICM54]|nr:hypothetical protein HMPREF1522_0696 [Actinomyces sp. ICM54]
MGTPETRYGDPSTAQKGNAKETIRAFLRPGLVDEGRTTKHPL